MCVVSRKQERAFRADVGIGNIYYAFRHSAARNGGNFLYPVILFAEGVINAAVFCNLQIFFVHVDQNGYGLIINEQLA